jgi:ABC-type spermidine/putrescine transport system permease subunit II
MVLPLFATLDRIHPSILEAGRDLGASPAQTFWRVTFPESRQGILAGFVICALPMFGDYFTQQLLAGTSGTRMIGNAVVDSLATPIFVPQGAALILFLLVLLIIPIVYYLRSTQRRRHRWVRHERVRRSTAAAHRVRDWLAEPWGRRVPVGVGDRLRRVDLRPGGQAVIFSFNGGRSITQCRVLLRWYITDPDASVLHDPALQHAVIQTLKLSLLTAVIAVPLGVCSRSACIAGGASRRGRPTS